MTYITALNDISINTNSLFNTELSFWKVREHIKSRPQYTTVEVKKLIPNLSFKSKSAITKVDSFINLRENWDSYGTEKPSKTAIENAKSFIKFAHNDGFEVYFTAPGRNGDVLVEFQLSQRISAEIYFNSDGSNELLIFDDAECITEGTVEDNYHGLMNYKNEYQRL